MKLLAMAGFVALSLFGPVRAAHAQEVEPGVIPGSPITAVEHTASGPVATPMHAAPIASNAHTGSNVARGLVYSGQHNTIELAGLKASFVLTTNTPTFYMHIDPEDPNDPRGQATLIRLKPTKENRIALNFTANAFGGGRKRHVDEVPVTKTDVSGGWLKVVPQAPLPPGEYGLMFLPKDALLFSDRVYDFSVPAK